MWIYFDGTTGNTVGYLVHGAPARVGQVNSFSIFSYFNGLNLSDYSQFTLSIKNPNGTVISNSAIFGTIDTQTFAKLNGETDIQPFIEGTSYTGIKFTNIPTFNMAGMYQATISIYNGTEVSVSSQFGFFVYPSSIDIDEETDITMSQYTALVTQIAGLLEKGSIMYVRKLTNTFHQIVHNSTNPDYYTILNNEDTTFTMAYLKKYLDTNSQQTTPVTTYPDVVAVLDSANNTYKLYKVAYKPAGTYEQIVEGVVLPLPEGYLYTELVLGGLQPLLTSANAGQGINITGSGANVVISTQAAAPAWGNITGTLANQTDLQTALNAKANDSAVVHKTGDEQIGGKKTFTDDIYSGLVTIYQDRIEIDGDEVAVADDLTNFITKSVNDLTNYYLKSETYTKQEVQAIISAIEKIEFVVASALPEASESTLNKIYLIPSTSSQTQNVKDEFITIRSGVEGSYTYAWEQIGSTSVDLSNYYTKAQTDALVNAKSVVSGTNDGTNWLTLNVNGTNKAIPQGDIDQTYGSTSANAQSGIAVAQAISGINIFPQLDQVTVTSSTYTISSDGIYIVTASNCVVTVNSDVKYAIIHFQDSTSHEITFTGGRTIIDENLSLLEVNYSETLYCGGRTNWTLTAIDKLVLTEGADL